MKERRTFYFLLLCHQVLEKAFYLHEKGQGEEAKLQYLRLSQNLEEFVGKTFNEWVVTVDKDLDKNLELTLMAKSLHKPGRIEVNFSRTLLRVFCEMYYWERLRFEMPHYSAEVYSRRGQLRVLRENVLLIIRDYNSIYNSLLPRERALFRERIRSLDKKVRPGLTKLTWSLEGVQEFFVVDCRSQAFRLRQLIKNYKSSNRLIGSSCRKLSELLFVHLDGKKVYENDQFALDQHRHCTAAKEKMKEIHSQIVSTMRTSFEVGNKVYAICLVLRSGEHGTC